MNIFTKNQITNNLKILILALILSAGITTISAWTNPPGSPPDCPTGTSGCDAPLHVGGAGQIKLGGLVVGSGVTSPAKALYVPGGFVGIGVEFPSEKVDVLGRVKTSAGYCIGADCISSWPTGGGGGGIGGSGTVNRIAKFIGTTAIGDSIIKEDDNKVGVGLGITSAQLNQKLVAEGYVKGTQGLCINDDCRNAWPTPPTLNCTQAKRTAGVTPNQGTLVIISGSVSAISTTVSSGFWGVACAAGYSQMDCAPMPVYTYGVNSCQISMANFSSAGTVFITCCRVQ